MFLDWIVKGGPVMILLLGCSVLSLTIIFERCFYWIVQSRRMNLSQLDKIMSQLQNDSSHSDQYVNTKNHVIQIVCKVIQKKDQTHREILEMELDRIAMESKRFLSGLDTIITLSPLLGIFGTVVGIIQSFHLLGSASIADPQLVSQGIAIALITTATGLAIAMPSLLFYNAFMSKIETHLYLIEKHVQEFFLKR